VLASSSLAPNCLNEVTAEDVSVGLSVSICDVVEAVVVLVVDVLVVVDVGVVVVGVGAFGAFGRPFPFPCAYARSAMVSPKATNRQNVDGRERRLMVASSC
jgi:hypothetical protein